MKYSDNELKEITELLDSFHKYLSPNSAQNIGLIYNKFYSSYSSFYRQLCDEAIISEDPYKNDYSTEKLDLPDSEEIPRSDEEYFLTVRLGHYQALLSYIRNDISFSFELLTIKKIKRIKKIITYIKWDYLFSHKTHFSDSNSASLNDLLSSFNQNNDKNFLITTLKEIAKNISGFADDLIQKLDIVLLYRNEKYKNWLRSNIFTMLKIPDEMSEEAVINFKKTINTIFNENQNFEEKNNKELNNQVILEDFTQKGAEQKLNYLEDLRRIAKEFTDNEEQAVPKSQLFKSALVSLTPISIQLVSCLKKMEFDGVLFRKSSFNIFEKIVDYLIHTVLHEKRHSAYILEIHNEGQIEPECRTIELEDFNEKTTLLANKLEQLKNKKDMPIQNLYKKSEKEIEDFLRELISSIEDSYVILSAFDKYFKQKISHVKGIQVELGAIKSLLLKSEALFLEATQE